MIGPPMIRPPLRSDERAAPTAPFPPAPAALSRTNAGAGLRGHLRFGSRHRYGLLNDFWRTHPDGARKEESMQPGTHAQKKGPVSP